MNSPNDPSKDGSRHNAGAPGAAIASPKRVWIPPTAAEVKETVLKAIGSRPVAESSGPIHFLSFNGRYLNREKAERLCEPLLELVRRAHVICVQETNVDALRYLARQAKYGLNASHRNLREQACGILFSPRMQWIDDEPTYHDYLCDIPGHPEYKKTMRPGVQRAICDLASDFECDVVDLHLKSNVGDEPTSAVRHWQVSSLVTRLNRQRDAARAAGHKVRPQIIGADYNTPIENPETTEVQPLIDAGFRRISTPDLRWSYKYFEKGGQFDGFFIRGLDDQAIECYIPEFFTDRRDAAFMREFSDHLPVFMTIAR